MLLPAMLRTLFAAGICCALGSRAQADVGALASDSFPYRHGQGLDLDAGLVVGFPTALPTGLSRGIGAGVTEGRCPLRWGARIAWVTATESTLDWQVTHSDLRLRAAGLLQHDIGRGNVALRLSAGGTLVHESRERSQGMRAGLMGSDLSTSTFALVPAGEFEAVVSLHVAGAWLVVMSGGPSAALVGGSDLHGGWIAQLGIGWEP
jgi:hypothetical protein